MATIMPVSEIRERMNANDMEVVNGVLSGEIQPVEEEQEVTQQPIENEQNVVQQDEVAPQTPEKDENVVQPDEEKEPEEDPREKYLRLKEEQFNSELQQKLQLLKDREEEVEREKRVREELEQELQRLKERVENPPVITVDEDDDDENEFITEYDRQSRKEIRELKQALLENNTTTNSDVAKRLEKLEKMIEDQREAQKKIELEKLHKEKRKRLFDEITNLQKTYPEISTPKPFEEIHTEYSKFRKDIATLVGAKSTYDLESAIDSYMKNGKIKEMADKNGITPIECLDKYLEIMALNDEKRGVTYDRYTGKEIPIVDDAGNRVVRRSLEEAYILKNYKKEINEARQRSFKDVQKKLEYVNNTPIQLKDEEVTPIQGGITPEQEREIINLDPRKIKDPDTLRLYEQTFRKYGIEPPKIRR